MSLIPLDEPRGDEQSTSGERGPTDGMAGRLWGRLRSALQAVLARDLGRPEEPTDGASTEPALGPVEDAGPSSSIARLDSNRQEFITTEHDGGLTLALADNPDAKITSDTWEPVER